MARLLEAEADFQLSAQYSGVKEALAWLDQHYVRALAQAPEPLPEAPRPKLTDRERLVLRGILEGLANKEIASRLDCSESAVKGILQQLFHKIGVRTRSQLVRIALEDYRDQL